jgi:hypothetical protein
MNCAGPFPYSPLNIISVAKEQQIYFYRSEFNDLPTMKENCEERKGYIKINYVEESKHP